jgi:hypothetical protein
MDIVFLKRFGELFDVGVIDRDDFGSALAFRNLHID